MALLDILECEMGDLVEPVAAAKPAKRQRRSAGATPGSGRFARNAPASPKQASR